jgi:hypothetical protein
MAAPLGNDNAKRTKPWRDAIDRALAQDDGARLRKIAETLLTKAAKGDMVAIKELGDRLDGKAPQAITGADGGPLVVINATQHDESL